MVTCFLILKFEYIHPSESPRQAELACLVKMSSLDISWIRSALGQQCTMLKSFCCMGELKEFLVLQFSLLRRMLYLGASEQNIPAKNAATTRGVV